MEHRRRVFIILAGGFWVLLVGFVALNFLIPYHVRLEHGFAAFYDDLLPRVLGTLALIWGIAALVFVVSRKLPLSAGLLCSLASVLAGTGFWFLFFLYVYSV